MVADGFRKRAVAVDIHQDVVGTLRVWRQQDIAIYVDNALLTCEQTKICLMNTKHGDLTPLITGIFGNDLEVMTQDVVTNYEYIFSQMRQPKQDILLLTTEHATVKQLDERRAGVPSIIVDRYESYIKRAYYWLKYVMVRHLSEIHFVNRPERRNM